MYTDRVFKDYYQDVSRFKLLTPADERQLLERYKTCPKCSANIPNRVPPHVCPTCNSCEIKELKSGSYQCLHCGARVGTQTTPQICVMCGARRDFDARDQLIHGNLRYVILVAKRFAKQTQHIIRLISAGNVGLVLAIDRFDLGRSTRLLAYADWWIRKEILDELNNLGVVTVPVHKQKALRRELKKNQYICLQCGVRVDDLTKVSKHTPCTANEHEFIPAANEMEVLSPVVNMDTVTLIAGVDIEDMHLSRETQHTIRGIVYSLPFRERDRFILLRYFDLVGDERCAGQKSLHKVASVLGITPERVRQIKESSLGILRKELKRMEIHDLSSLRMS